MDDETRKALEDFKYALAFEHARIDAHLLIISAVLNALREVNPPTYEATRLFLLQSENSMTKEGLQGPLVDEIRLVLKEVFQPPASKPQH